MSGVGHAEHREVACIELVPLGAEFFSGTPLMCLTRILRLAAEHDRGSPLLLPEAFEHDGLLEYRDGVQGGSIGGPFRKARGKVDEKSLQALVPGWAIRHVVLDRRRARNNVADFLAVHERQSIGENQTCNTPARKLRGLCQHHTASRSADQHHVAQILRPQKPASSAAYVSVLMPGRS